MPLHNIISGNSTRCTAKARHRNEQCMNLAAYGQNICRFHGAVHPDKRIKGTAHYKYKHGEQTIAKQAERKAKGALIRNCEDVLILLDAIDGGRTSGKVPFGYEPILTMEQAQAFITKLEAKK